MLLVLLLDFSGNPESNWNPWYLIIYGVFTIVGVGVREECIYRATLQNILAKKYANSVKGIWITVIVSSIIFGLSHVPNIFFNVTPSAVLDQSISAVFVGILFGAVYLRSGNLWVLILIHTLTDVASLSSSIFLRNVSDVEVMNQQLSFSWGSMIYNLILVGIAAFLLRPSKFKQIQESFCFDKRE
jgi:membrane protease YdiL (CAAX protease family)